MKILIGYNGSQLAESALDDLRLAGLPSEAEILILTVAEVWLPPENTDDAEILAWRAEKRLKEEFSGWRITTEVTHGSPSRQILGVSENFQPDLIVIGERRQPPNERTAFLRGTAHKILDEAKCSVRLARGVNQADNKIPRVIIGFDGSDGAWAAVDEVASRFRRQKAEVHLVLVSDSTVSSSIGRFVAPVSNSFSQVRLVRQQMETLAEAPLRKLKNAGLRASLSVGAGNPRDVLIEMAERWHADSIFVGPNSLGKLFEKYLLGSVSASVASTADCSVEVVRRNHWKK